MGANWILYGNGEKRVAAELAKALHGTTLRLNCATKTKAPKTKAAVIEAANAACSRAQSAALADAGRLDAWSGNMDANRQAEYYAGRARQTDDLIAALEPLRASPKGDVIPAAAIDALRAYAQWARSIVQQIEATQTTFRQMSPQTDIETFRSAFSRGACTDVFDMN